MSYKRRKNNLNSENNKNLKVNIENKKLKISQLNLKNDKDINDINEIIKIRNSKSATTDKNMENLQEGSSSNRINPVFEKFYYKETDIAPFRVIVKEKNCDNNENIKNRFLNKIRLGYILKDLKIKGINDIKNLNKQSMIVYFDNKDEANNFVNNITLRIKNLIAFIPKFFISASGIIKGIPTDLELDRIKEEIEESNNFEIIDMLRFKKKIYNTDTDSNEFKDTETLKISFRLNKIPKEMNLFYTKIKVEPFIQSVITCYKCLRYNHKAVNCKASMLRCGKCQENHDTRDCKKNPKCLYCQEDHETNDKTVCNEYMKHKSIKNIMGKNNCTYVEAIENHSRYIYTKNSFDVLDDIEENFPAINTYAEKAKYRLKNFKPKPKIWNNKKHFTPDITMNKNVEEEKRYNLEKEEEIRGVGLNNIHATTEAEKENKKLKDFKGFNEKLITNLKYKNYNYVEEDIELINKQVKLNKKINDEENNSNNNMNLD